MQYRFTCAQHNVVLGGCPEFYPAAEDAAGGVAEWVIDLSDMSCSADDASDNGSGCSATWQITAAGVSLAAFTPAETAGLSDALAVAENADEHLTRDQLAAAAKLDAAFAAAPGPPADRYPAPDPAGTDWDAYPPLSDETACLVMQEILVDTEFLWLTAVNPPSGERAEVTIVDAVTTFAGNCWDDQHDGGAHRQNLIDANRLLGWLDRPDLRDDYNDVHSLVGDDVPEPERWASRP